MKSKGKARLYTQHSYYTDFIDWSGRTFHIKELSLSQHLENAEAARGRPQMLDCMPGHAAMENREHPSIRKLEELS